MPGVPSIGPSSLAAMQRRLISSPRPTGRPGVAPHARKKKKGGDAESPQRTTFVTPSPFASRPDPNEPSARCIACGGLRVVTCEPCKGSGLLARGGFHRRNTFDVRRVVGTQWTAMERTLGWRHFHASETRKLNGKTRVVRLVASCDDDSASLWVPVQTLRDRDRWASGYLTLSEMRLHDAEGAGRPERSCSACSGTGLWECRACKGSGVQDDVVEL